MTRIASPQSPTTLAPAAARGTPGALASLGRLLRSKGAWALGDQAVLSLGNFLTSVLLIRHWHGAPETYGQYALVLSVVLFLNSLHASLVTYPLTVLGAGAGAEDHRRRTGRSLGVTLCLWPALGAAVAAATLAARRPSLLPWAAGALLLWQLQETLRRALLARLRHRDALPGDVVSYLGQAALVWLLTRRVAGTNLSPEAAFFAVGATSAAGALIQAFQLGAAPGGWSQLRQTLGECWRLGRWLLLSALVSAGTVYVSPWTLQGARGSADVAKFSALATMLNLTNPVLFSVGGLIVPAVAAAKANGRGAAAAARAASRFALQGAVLLVPYLLFLAAAPRLAMRIFYGPDSPYLELTAYLRLFALGWAMAYLLQVCTAVLNGLERARSTFLSTAVGAAANLALTVPLAVRFGLAGAVWGGMLPIVLQLLTAARLLRRATEDQDFGQALGLEGGAVAPVYRLGIGARPRPGKAVPSRLIMNANANATRSEAL